MQSQTHRVIGLAVAAFVLVTGTAQAQGKSHENGKDKDKDRDKGREQEQGNAKARHGDERRELEHEGNRVVVRNGNHPTMDVGTRVPPGLAKKPGGMPPGQYKKRYLAPQGGAILRDVLASRGYTVVRYNDVGPSQYVYYRLRDGSVQRAVVTPGAEQLTFSNVPAALLREVLSRLY